MLDILLEAYVHSKSMLVLREVDRLYALIETNCFSITHENYVKEMADVIKDNIITHFSSNGKDISYFDLSRMRKVESCIINDFGFSINNLPTHDVHGYRLSRFIRISKYICDNVIYLSDDYKEIKKREVKNEKNN